MKDLRINEYIIIPASEFEVSFARSSGPGGQNVNKVNSKVFLRWFMGNNQSLPVLVLERLRAIVASRLTEDGSLHVTSQIHREQAANLRECTMKIQRLVAQALIPPKSRKVTRPSLGSQRRRLEEKAKRGQTKQNRSTTGWDG